MRSSSHRTSPETSSSRRSVLRRWLEQLGGRDTRSTKRGRLQLETLENRQLLAGDVELFFTDGTDNVSDEPSQTSSTLQVTGEAESQMPYDLVAFAKLLSEKGATFYGANWCPACTEQKEIFQDGGKYLPFVEVTNPDRTRNLIGEEEDIRLYPTWEFPNRTDRVEGEVLDLDTIAQLLDIDEIPEGVTPSFDVIPPQAVGIGSPLHVPIDVYDPDGGVQTVTVTVEDESLLKAEVLSGNRSLRFDMQGWGDMVIELFEQRAPDATARLIELANDDFYNNVVFHRIVNNFMIQGGDPTGTGRGGSSLDDVDDQFHEELQHNRGGLLSWAKAADDTNNSQFFITERATRDLDFNHMVTGILTEGEKNREAISNTDTTFASNGEKSVPTTPVRITSVSVFNDNENSVVMLMPTGNATGSTNVTFTVTDQQGNSFSQTVAVAVGNDNANGQPFLDEINLADSYVSNEAAEIQLASTDVEDDPVTYFIDTAPNNNQVTAAIDQSGLLTVTPNGFVGEVTLTVAVEPGPGLVGHGDETGPNPRAIQDSQQITLNFEAEQVDTPSSLDLLSDSDSGFSDTDNITNEESLSFEVDGVTDGARVEIILAATGSVIGFADADSSGKVTITTSNIAALNEGSYELVARQRIDGVVSDESTPITVVYDTTQPDSVIGSAALRGNVDVEYQSDLISDEEGDGLSYTLVTGPTGAGITEATGLITWTPTETQLGDNSFTIDVTDAAGNTRTESFNVEVAGDPLVAVKLQLTDLDGNEITSVSVGQEFNLNLIGEDKRNAFDREGVAGAFADILFNSSLVRPVAGVPIDYGTGFGGVNSGTFLDGEIDELGATFSVTAATNERESLIATVRFEAIGSGSLNFHSNPAEATLSEMLLFGESEEIDDARVEYQSASLAIGQTFIVRDDSQNVGEDSGENVINVSGNDEVLQGTATLSVVSVTQPADGGSVDLRNGQVFFTPELNFNGDAVFTYRVSDSNGAQDDGTVTITVTGVNDPPTGGPDNFNVDENSTENTLDVLANDDDAPDTGETLTITGIDNASPDATIEISTDGQMVIYTPPADFSGTDSFTYTVSDGTLETEVQAVVFVAPSDPPPTANDDSFDVNEDDPEAEFGLLSNDEPDDSDQAFVLDSAEANQGGSVRISDDGTQFFYAPAADFFGTEEVVYTIRDTGGGVATATATFTVDGSNDAPPFSNPTVRISRGSSESVALRISDLPENVDGSGETLSFANLGTAGGSVRIDGNGDILYTPPSADFVGTDTFTYDVEEDTSDLTSSGTVTIDVTDLIPRNIMLDAGLADLPVIAGIKLVGTDALGQPVDVPIEYRNGSGPLFSNVLPGEYRVEIPAIPFLIKAQQSQSIPVSSGVDDGDMTVTPDLGRLHPDYISIRDWFGSASRSSIIVAVAPGSSSILSDPTPTTEATTITNPVITLNDAGDRFSIRGEAPTGGVIESDEDISTESSAQVEKRGEVDGIQLLKIFVDDVNFVDMSSSRDSTPEGELIAPATSNLTVSGAAEGELLEDLPAEISGEVSHESSVDEAMQAVAEQLTLISPTGEALAEAADEPSSLGDSAVDQALAGQL